MADQGSTPCSGDFFFHFHFHSSHRQKSHTNAHTNNNNERKTMEKNLIEFLTADECRHGSEELRRLQEQYRAAFGLPTVVPSVSVSPASASSVPTRRVTLPCASDGRKGGPKRRSRATSTTSAPDPPFVSQMAADGLDVSQLAAQIIDDHGGAAHFETILEAAKSARRSRDGAPFPEADIRRALSHVLASNPFFYKTVPPLSFPFALSRSLALSILPLG